jgi:catechol 2,3-dioxygenase-like lactoylglutathione lyase family enzyme
MPIRPVGLAHVNLNVTDLHEAERFYVEVLGFQVVGKYAGTIAWLNLGQYHPDIPHAFHDLALYQVPHAAAEDRRRRVGMNHLALRLAHPQDVDAAVDVLRMHGVTILKGPLTHKEDQDRYVYFEDPFGNMIELVSSTLPDFPQAYLR